MNIAKQGPILRISDIPELGAASPLLFGSLLAQLLCGDIRQVEIDLTETEFVDCAGAGALLSFRNSAQRENPGIEFRVLLSPRAAVKRLFALLGLDRVFAVLGSSPTESVATSAKPENAAPAPAFACPAALPLLEVPTVSTSMSLG